MASPTPLDVIQLFKSVFRGREDVFAVRWEKGGKKGYMPAYFYDPYRYRIHKINGGTFQNYTDKEYLILTEREIEKHLNGEQHIGIYPLLKENTGEKGGITAAKAKHQVIMTPYKNVYLDLNQTENEKQVTQGGLTLIEKVYNYDPVPKELTSEETNYVLGSQACLWTEYISNPAKAEYMLFPRLSALSEVLWSSKENKNWIEFQKKIETQKKRYDIWGTNYFKE